MTKTRRGEKPKKPYPDFPLYPHNCGQWVKKIKGRLFYFGPWDDRDAALEKYRRQRDDLYAGRTPRELTDQGPTIKDLGDRFLTDKRMMVQAGELTERSWLDYERSAKMVAEIFGRHRLVATLRPDDFNDLRAELIRRGLGVNTVANEITRVRVLFNYAGPNRLGWLSAPVAFGPLFRRPSAKTIRVAKSKAAPKMIPAGVIHAAIDAARPQLKAMILMGINAGLGNSDCANLRLSHFSPDGRWLVFPRGKTGMYRQARLWRITREAVVEAIESRPNDLPQGLESYVFVTRYRSRWEHENRIGSCPISQAFRRLLDSIGGYEKGRAFYSLRHTHQTIGEECGDLVAVSTVMGHVDSSMAGNYRQSVSDARIARVAATIRRWLG